MSLAGPPRWFQAAAFAARAHASQLRRDGRTPYAAHAFRVALTVRDTFGCADDTALCAALLHDVIEDTPADYDDVHLAFGPDVASCVAALTKNMILPEPERETDYDHRLAQADWRARLVKLADVLDNLEDSERVTPKALERCTRALDLAEPDAAAHEPIARAIERVRTRMAARS